MGELLSANILSIKTATLNRLRYLELRRDRAQTAYFEHNDPGGLTPPEKQAWELERIALYLRFLAAQTLYGAEMEMASLLEEEVA